MGAKIFQEISVDLLKRSLDAYTLRQRVIAENIANAETPGYESRSVQFEELLEKVKLNNSASGHLPEPKVLEDSPRAIDNGVNNVSLDMEMAALAETTLSHKLASRVLAMRYQLLRTAIRGRN